MSAAGRPLRALIALALGAALVFVVVSAIVVSSRAGGRAGASAPPPRLAARAEAERATPVPAWHLDGAGRARTSASLAALHREAGRVLEDPSGLAARIRALRGHPVVLNAWASWCPPCREELPLFAYASHRYGDRVAFLGADVDDDAGSARSLLSTVGLAYPSYATTRSGVASVAAVPGTPATVFIGSDGTIRHVHAGEYPSQAALVADVARYAS